MGWVVNATHRPLYPRQRPGTHCTRDWVGPRAGLGGAENLSPTGIPSPDRPACSESLYRLRDPGPPTTFLDNEYLTPWGLRVVLQHVRINFYFPRRHHVWEARWINSKTVRFKMWRYNEIQGEIWGADSGVDNVSSLHQRYSWACRWFQAFLSPKMATLRSSDKSVNNYQSTRRNIVVGSNLQWNTLFMELGSRFDRNQYSYDGIHNDRVAQYFSL